MKYIIIIIAIVVILALIVILFTKKHVSTFDPETGRRGGGTYHIYQKGWWGV